MPQNEPMKPEPTETKPKPLVSLSFRDGSVIRIQRIPMWLITLTTTAAGAAGTWWTQR
ncbi:hypothetical protein [Streptomyces sp. NPDC047141]|uniref:hypothetical protein n=1 Tax=Streptomyces sp. NPDC047141 TaxID=3155738 RepID=UPI0033DB210E